MILIRNVITLLRIFLLLGPHRQNLSVSGTESVGPQHRLFHVIAGNQTWASGFQLSSHEPRKCNQAEEQPNQCSLSFSLCRVFFKEQYQIVWIFKWIFCGTIKIKIFTLPYFLSLCFSFFLSPFSCLHFSLLFKSLLNIS